MRIPHRSWAGFSLVVFYALMLGVASQGWAANAHSGSEVHQVSIPEEDRFTPYALTIHTGESVQWVNKDTDDHTVVSDDQTIKSKALDTDDTFSFTFTTPGTYEYFCSLHPHMVGTVVVEPADGADKPSP